MTSEQFPFAREWSADPDFGIRADEDLLTITSEHHDGTVLVQVIGEVEFASADRLLAALAAELARGPARVLVDVYHVTFIDCAGVTVLVDATRRAERNGICLQVVPGRALTRLSEILGLAGELDLEDRRR